LPGARAVESVMDLDRHLSVLWERRAIVIAGVVLGLVTALLAAYKPSADGLEPRGSEEWSSTSTLLVTPKGFPWGRVTSPGPPQPGVVTSPEAPSDRARASDPYGEIPLDPARLTNLAQVYAVMASSDRVRRRLPGYPSAKRIKAFAIDPTGRGDQLLPVFELTTTAGSPTAARELNRRTVAALRLTLTQEQRQNVTPEKDRVHLEVLKRAGSPVLVSGRSWITSLLAFALCFGAAIALAHLLENLSMTRARKRRPVSAVGQDLELTANPFSNAGSASDSANGGATGAPLSRISTYRDRLRDG
jgi:hypothetical protein